MPDRFKDIEHLLRLAGLFLLGLLLFLVVRAALVPEGFGELGHFRTGSLQDNRNVPIVLAGREACADCHTDKADAVGEGSHAGVGCESCHGALAGHLDDPSAVVPQPPDPVQLCPVCHQSNVAIPDGFPQVDAAEHSGGLDCADCHEPHQPRLDM
jgi:hypothetical protein